MIKIKPMKLKVRYNYAEEVCSPYHEGYSWKAYQTSVTVEIKELTDAEAPLAFVLHRSDKKNNKTILSYVKMVLFVLYSIKSSQLSCVVVLMDGGLLGIVKTIPVR